MVPELKRLYANYLDDPNHLIAVTARANRSKGARGPEEWKPPDRSYWCRYAVDWTTIKHKWDLTATPAEFAALDGMLNTCDATHLLGVAVTFEKPNLPTFGGSTPPPTPLPAVQTADTIPVRTRSPQVNPASSAVKVRGRGFPKAVVPSARHGDGDGVVCER